MARAVEETLKRRWVDVYLLFVGIVSVLYGILASRIRSGWWTGEWLINYAGGFVRRGLGGEFLLLVSHATRLDLVWLALAAQVAVYTCFLVAARNLARRTALTWGTAFLVLSPATFSFVVLDPPSGLKKEILLFALLASILVVLLSRQYEGQTRWQDWQLSVALVLLAPAIVLTHEPLILYFPYLLAAVVVFGGGWRRAFGILVFPAALSLGAAVAAVTHPGNAQTAEAVCRSVGGSMPSLTGPYQVGLCSGGISALTVTLQEAHVDTMKMNAGSSAIWIYSLLAIPSLLPALIVLFQLFRRGVRNDVAVIAWLSALSCTLSLLLFYGATDYGRWIHIHAVCLTLLALAMKYRQAMAAPRESSSRGIALRWKVGRWLALIVWATCWNLPAVLIYPGRSGYFGLYQYVRGYGTLHSARQRSIH